jgi:hypothetical protein
MAPKAKPTEREVEVLGLRVPASLLGVADGRKYDWSGTWVLTTKRGVLIGFFGSERELDNWWHSFQSSQSKSAKRCRKLETPHRGIVTAAEAIPEICSDCGLPFPAFLLATHRARVHAMSMSKPVKRELAQEPPQRSKPPEARVKKERPLYSYSSGRPCKDGDKTIPGYGWVGPY